MRTQVIVVEDAWWALSNSGYHCFSPSVGIADCNHLVFVGKVLDNTFYEDVEGAT